jgi:hypothetical protein
MGPRVLPLKLKTVLWIYYTNDTYVEVKKTRLRVGFEPTPSKKGPTICGRPFSHNGYLIHFGYYSYINVSFWLVYRLADYLEIWKAAQNWCFLPWNPICMKESTPWGGNNQQINAIYFRQTTIEIGEQSTLISWLDLLGRSAPIYISLTLV